MDNSSATRLNWRTILNVVGAIISFAFLAAIIFGGIGN